MPGEQQSNAWLIMTVLQNERLIAGILPPHRGSIRLKRYAVREFVARERWNGVFFGSRGAIP
ncbi:MAG: hypothetical protein O7F73_11720 [Gammaproteobacteria bacterium]|nr:hypothetical protein [Gammaproteobacteria bacterium]